MIVLGIILVSLLFLLDIIGISLQIRWRREEKTLCHQHSEISHVQVRHHREICTCGEAEKWGEEAREIWGDVLRAYPKLSRAHNVLYLLPIKDKEIFGHPTTEGIVVDPGKGSEDEVRSTIAHELHHRIQDLRFGWRVLVQVFFEMPARFRFKRGDYHDIYYYLCFPSEMAALVFSANYSRADADLLRCVRTVQANDPLWEVVAELKGKRKRKR